MQMLNHLKVNNKSIRKSHLLIIGSFLVFLGIVVLSWNHLKVLRNIVFSDMQIAISNSMPDNTGEVVIETPNAEELNNSTQTTVPDQTPAIINYDKYLGVLEIPRIGLKRGFYGTDSKYNDIQYNVTVIKGSTMPDVVNGNLILMAHSGNTYLGFFAYLHRLEIGNDAYVTYNGNKYHYQLVNRYDVPKVGIVKVVRNFSRTTLTLITCTKGSDTSQTVFVFELV